MMWIFVGGLWLANCRFGKGMIIPCCLYRPATVHRKVAGGQYETTGCRWLFSYKSPLFCKLRISLQNSPAKAPDDKGFRPLRRATKDAVFGNCHLLKKVDENFISRNWVPRGRSSGYLLNRYVNWVQAQPGGRHHAAVNWVQAQPVVDWVLMVTATRLGMQTALCSSLSSQPNPMQRWSGQSEDRKWMR